MLALAALASAMIVLSGGPQYVYYAFWAQVAVFRPGEPSLWDLWGNGPDRGVELRTGNPPFTPALAAAVQAAEAVKLLTGVGTPLRGTLLWFDLAEGTSQPLRYAPESGSPGATRS